jgi:hypothetical protein
MPRNRQSAKKAGTAFETLIAKGLREALGDNAIERAPRWGSVDKGDIINVTIDGHPIVIQAKDVARLALPSWTEQARVQAANARAVCGVVVHKRVGTTDPMKQWVSCTLEDFVALISKTPVTKGNKTVGE